MAEEKEYRQNSKDSTRQRSFFNLGHTLQILKAAFPYMDRRSKNTMDLFIKAGDLFESLNGINNDASVSAISLDEGDKIDMVGMLKEIRKVCHDNEVKMIDMLLNVMNAMELYETYVNLYSMMASQGDGFSGLGNLFGMDSSSSNPEDMIDMLSAMLPPEDKETLDNINMVLKMMSNTKSTTSSSNDASSKEGTDEDYEKEGPDENIDLADKDLNQKEDDLSNLSDPLEQDPFHPQGDYEEDTPYEYSPEENDFYYDGYNMEYKPFHDLENEEDR